MRSLRLSAIKRIAATGLSKAVAAAILFPAGTYELGCIAYIAKYGFRAMGELGFVLFLWNTSVCIALIAYILTWKRRGYGGDNSMEVSNYLNLNKLGRDKY